MSRRFTPKVVTANHLLEGHTIWLRADGHWSADPREAELILDADRAQERLGMAEAMPAIAVGAYLADAVPGEDGPAPTHFREAFRRRGPSNYAHGKQKELGDV